VGAHEDAQPPAEPPRRGRPIAECTPLDLEVHRAITMEGHPELPLLPRYVTRAHDEQLRLVIEATAAGSSRLAMLVGGSSTGKTRACWEAIQALDERWRVWHAIDPSRPGAAAAALAEVGPHTVLWVNDAQHYLLTADPALGERVAAGLRTLLTDHQRGPVLVIGTIWPEFWHRLTATRHPNDPDPYAQARQLLTGTEIVVPDAFTAADRRRCGWRRPRTSDCGAPPSTPILAA
jgi:hypothetical protein